MSGDWLALGAVVALAAAGAVRGSRSKRDPSVQQCRQNPARFPVKPDVVWASAHGCATPARTAREDERPPLARLFWNFYTKERPRFPGEHYAEIMLTEEQQKTRLGDYRWINWGTVKAETMDAGHTCPELIERLHNAGHRGPVFSVMNTWLAEVLREQGLGVEAYALLGAGLSDHFDVPSVILVNDACSGGGTSPSALRVWKSLARRFSGYVEGRQAAVAIPAWQSLVSP